MLQVETSHLKVEVARVKRSDSVPPAEWDAYYKKVEALATRTAALQVKVEILRRLATGMWFMLGAAAVLLIVGFKMAQWGFSRWYERVQKPLDAAAVQANKSGVST